MCNYKFKELISNNRFYISKMEQLGITDKYIGFYYVVEILGLILNKDYEEIGSFYKDVYPIVAKRFSKSECTIERNIRNLIKQVWNKEMESKLNRFWKSERPPSCCKFIYILKQYIKSMVV